MNIDDFRTIKLSKLEYELRNKYDCNDDNLLREAMYEAYCIGGEITSLLHAQLMRSFGKTKWIELQVNEKGEIINE